jgi:DUF1009 family protein
MSVLGLIAGSGPLPFEVVEAVRGVGMDVAIAAIERNTDPRIETHAPGPLAWFAAGELDRVIAFFKEARATEVVLAGAVAKKELLRDPSALRPDARVVALLARLQERGDDALLRGVAEELESAGLPVVSSTKHLGERLTSEGALVGGPLAPAVQADLALGLRVAKGLGIHDVGQGVVVRSGTVVAVEAVEGTDAMIRRGAELSGPGAVVVKVAKPGQDLRFDVPAIGPGTISAAEAGGVVAIGLEAGRTIVLERERALAAARRADIAIVGMKPEPS